MSPGRGAIRLLRCRRGAAAIEFAVIATLLAATCLAVVEFGRGLHLRNQLGHAADLVARTVLTDSEITDAELEAALRAAVRVGDPDRLHVTIGSETVAGVEFRTVSLKLPVRLLIPRLAAPQVTLRLERRIPLP